MKDWLLKANAKLEIVSWSRNFGAQAIVSPWLSLDMKCSCAVLRHPGCSSSCSMLVHMAVSGKVHILFSRCRNLGPDVFIHSFETWRIHLCLWMQRRRHYVNTGFVELYFSSCRRPGCSQFGIFCGSYCNNQQQQETSQKLQAFHV